MAVINSYEAVIVISLKLGEEGIAETIAKFKDMVSKNGTLENVDEWGKRRLAYEINKELRLIMFSLISRAKLSSLQSLTVSL